MFQWIMMKKTILFLTLAGLSQFTYAAEEAEQPSPNPIKFGLYAGLTYGGDEVGKLYYEDDSTERVKAGGLYTVGASLSANVWQQVDVQVNLGYHADSASASNGDMTFSRVVFEAIPYYRLNESVSLGLGLTLHSNVEFDSDFTEDATFESATGVVLSGKYALANTNSEFEFRFVSQEYTLEKVGNFNVIQDYTVDAKHLGVYYHYMF